MSTVNLLPEEYVQRREQRRANRLCVVLFALVMVGVVGAVLVSQQSSWHTLQVRNRVEQEYAEATRLIQQMQSLEAKKTAMLHKAALTASLLEKVPRSYLLAIVTKALPEHASLVKLTLDRSRVISPSGGHGSAKFDQAAATMAPGSDETLAMTITGLAATDIEVARFIANLASNPLIGSVDLVYSEERMIDKKYRARSFQVAAAIRTDVDVMDVLAGGDEKTDTALASAGSGN